MADGMKTGRLFGVGTGPGDPELLTVKAIKAIRRATVLLVDDLVGDGVLRYARRSARIVHVGKRGGCRSTPQAFIEKLMEVEARKGERVVRLKGGDPIVFGRGGEEAEHLRAQGIEVEVINGYSAHADRTELRAWVRALGGPVMRAFVVHGEDRQRQAMAAILKEEGVREVYLPAQGESFEA